MKNLVDISNKIIIDEFFANSKILSEKFKPSYEKFCKAEEIIKNGVKQTLYFKPFIKYTVNFDYISELFNNLHNNCTTEEKFKMIQYNLIVMRDFIFLFNNVFMYKDKNSSIIKSIFKSLDKNTLNFKYVKDTDLQKLKYELEFFYFCITGLCTDVSAAFSGVYTTFKSINEETYIFGIPGTSVILNFMTLIRAIKASYNGIKFLKCEDKIDLEFMKSCKDIL